jgi:two-component system, chemotaxis family, sensor kinase CheA
VDALFAAADALEQAIEVAVEDGDHEADVGPAIARLRALTGEAEGEAPAPSGELPAPEDAGDPEAGAMRVRVTIDPASALPGVRAFMAVRAARELGEVTGMEPSEAALQEEGFGGTVRFVLRTGATAAEVEAALLACGEVGEVEVAEGLVDPPAPAAPGEEGRRRGSRARRGAGAQHPGGPAPPRRAHRTGWASW